MACGWWLFWPINYAAISWALLTVSSHARCPVDMDGEFWALCLLLTLLPYMPFPLFPPGCCGVNTNVIPYFKVTRQMWLILGMNNKKIHHQLSGMSSNKQNQSTKRYLFIKTVNWRETAYLFCTMSSTEIIGSLITFSPWSRLEGQDYQGIRTGAVLKTMAMSRVSYRCIARWLWGHATS